MDGFIEDGRLTWGEEAAAVLTGGAYTYRNTGSLVLASAAGLAAYFAPLPVVGYVVFQSLWRRQLPTPVKRPPGFGRRFGRPPKVVQKAERAVAKRRATLAPEPVTAARGRPR